MSKRVLLGSLVLIASVAFWWTRPSASSDAGKAVKALQAPAKATAQAQLPISVYASDEPAESSAPAKTGPAFFAAWGGGDTQLGRERPDEGNPMGPMSFATDAQGRVIVLDGVNGRLVRRDADGNTERVMPIDAVNPEDMAAGADGSLAVLDRFRDKAVTVLDESGTVRGKLPLEGDGIDDVGSVTSVIVDGQDVYAERDNGPLVKLGTTTGAIAQPRTEIPGRPSRDGQSFLNAGIIDFSVGRVYVSSIERATHDHRFTRELRLEARVRRLLLLDTDLAGVIYLGAELERSATHAEVVVLCLDPGSGVPTGHVVLPENTLPEESFRDLVVLNDGGVVYALRTDQGVSYQRYDCQ